MRSALPGFARIATIAAIAFVPSSALIVACSLVTDTSGLSGGAFTEAGSSSFDASDAANSSTPPSGVDLVDDSADDFARGTHDNTQWDGAKLTLAAGMKSGDFTSRIFDVDGVAGGAPRKIAAVEWRPSAPYGKALPDEQKAETGYTRGAVDMRDDALLLHFEDNVDDRSGAANPVAVGSTGIAFTDTLFGRGFADTATTWAYVMMSSSTPFAFGTSDFTWSVWVKTTTKGCTSNMGSFGNQVYIGGEDAPDARPHTWLGCSAVSTVCPSKDGTGRVSGYIATTQADGQEWCGARTIDDGLWHHLALVKKGHPQSSVVIYLDGTIETSLALSFQSTFTYDAPSQLAIGSFSLGAPDSQSDAQLDDVAIARRAFSADEIANLSARGHLRVGLTVRACATPTCADNPAFVGPNADAKKSFLDTGLSPPARADVSFLPETRYVQYRLHLESDDPASAPSVESVTVVLQ